MGKYAKFDQEYLKYETEVCKGKPFSSIAPKMKKDLGIDLPKEEDFLRYFVDNFDKNESIWPVIQKAKERFGVGLLTNMYTGMLDLIEQKGIMPEIEWDVVIDSSIEKCAKPDKEIFEKAQKRAGVDVDEIFFVDNTKRHVESASELGWHTYWYDPSDTHQSSKKLSEIITNL